MNSNQSKSAKPIKHYKVIGRHTEGSKIIGYEVLDIQTNKHFTATKDQLYQACKQNKVSNCRALITADNQQAFCGINCKLSELPTLNYSKKPLVIKNTQPKKASQPINQVKTPEELSLEKLQQAVDKLFNIGIQLYESKKELKKLHVCESNKQQTQKLLQMFKGDTANIDKYKRYYYIILPNKTIPVPRPNTGRKLVMAHSDLSNISDEELNNIEIAYGVTDISNWFFNKNGLVNPPLISASVQKMDWTFYNCENLRKPPIIPNKVVSMEASFKNCSLLEQAPELPLGLKNLMSCFTRCTSLVTTPSIPSSVANLSFAFKGCSSLVEAASIPQGVLDIEQCFKECISLLKAPTLPSSIQNDTECFYGCILLRDINKD